MSHFQIGWAEYSLTPDKKVSLVGQFAERISEYVEKPLCVTAMAVSTDSDQAVFCSCDLVGVSWSLRDAVREKLAGNTVGLAPLKVIISVQTGHHDIHEDQLDIRVLLQQFQRLPRSSGV